MTRETKIRVCKIANEDHAESVRVYAHTFHRKNVICVADAFWDLPEIYQVAILLHEVGHLLAGQRASEDAANKAVKKASGVTIWHKDTRYGEELEWISPSNKKRAKEFLGLVRRAEGRAA
jgi:hypothetical protein